MTERLRLLTARDFAELVGLSTETSLRRYRAGEIPGVARGEQRASVDRADAEAWLERCTQLSELATSGVTVLSGGGVGRSRLVSA